MTTPNTHEENKLIAEFMELEWCPVEPHNGNPFHHHPITQAEDNLKI